MADLKKVNIFDKFRKCMKILDDAPYHPGLTDHIMTLCQKYLENLDYEKPISDMLFGLSLFKKSQGLSPDLVLEIWKNY